MTSYLRVTDDWGNEKLIAQRLPPPGEDTLSWYVGIPGMEDWLARVRGVYRWCAKCLVVRRTENHEAHMEIHKRVS